MCWCPQEDDRFKGGRTPKAAAAAAHWMSQDDMSGSCTPQVCWGFVRVSAAFCCQHSQPDGRAAWWPYAPVCSCLLLKLKSLLVGSERLHLHLALPSLFTCVAAVMNLDNTYLAHSFTCFILMPATTWGLNGCQLVQMARSKTSRHADGHGQINMPMLQRPAMAILHVGARVPCDLISRHASCVARHVVMM